MAATDPLDPLRRATDRLNAAEAERNRMLRQLRSIRLPLAKLSEAADLSVGTVHRLTRPSVLVSVGYEGKTIDQFMGVLRELNVATLVDVRENAISRKRGFSRRGLEAACGDSAVAYVHEPTLGNPTHNRDGFREGSAASVKAYEDHMTTAGAGALQRVAQLLIRQTVALLCFEADPCSCHRSVVSAYLQRTDPLAEIRLA